MNKKTFAVAVLINWLTIIWLGFNIYWKVSGVKSVCPFDLLLGVVFVAATSAMVHHEFRKKRRRHLSDVDKHHIP